MPFVVDASVAMAWCFEDEATDVTRAALDRLAEATAVAPALWALEVANVLLVAERRGRITEFQASRFVRLLGQLPISLDPAPPDVAGLVAAGRQHGLSAYDAAYLTLAEREGLPLASTDAKLTAAARTAGLPLFSGP